MYEKEIQWIIKEKYNGDAKKEDLAKDVARLKKGEPVDFIIGFSDFLGCKIDLSSRPLIPRPETEFWVSEFLDSLKIEKLDNYFKNSKIKNLKILDLFAGSGCIGIAILKHIKNAKVDFAEIDEKFLKQIKINLKLNGIEKSRYKIIKSNVFSRINPPSFRSSGLRRARYDFILANPPYIAKTKKDKVGKSVLMFEPEKALFGGDDGLFFIRKFLKEAPARLNARSAFGGKIYMEFDSWQKPEIEKILKKFDYKNYEIKKDQYKKWRYVVIKND